MKKLIPHLQNVDGIAGFDRAHKRCAQLSQTNRLVIIDGDNRLLTPVKKMNLSNKLLKSDMVLSYSSQNSINSLAYGNGGIKCWPKHYLLRMQSHENSQTEQDSTDFCFTTPYYQLPYIPSLTVIDLTPKQAYRAGYREGVKMCLNNGKAFSQNLSPRQILAEIMPINLYRLKVWCEIGRHKENGVWAIYGARQAVFDTLVVRQEAQSIRDYQWFDRHWDQEISQQDPYHKTKHLRVLLQSQCGFILSDYDSTRSSEIAKNLYNPIRKGLM